VHAEVRGRVTALAEHKKIRALEFDPVGIEGQPSRSSKMAGA
jgi:hypothetical protein